MIEGIGAAGWRGDGPSRRHWKLGGGHGPEHGVEGSALDPRACPGRWNPKRAIPPETDPLAAAAALALEDAGWWRPGQTGPVSGGLVAGIDGANLLPAERFLRDLLGGRTTSPGDFLFSLPSSPAAVLGILFGLADYQATAVGGRDAGLRALRHTLDLLELRRVERILLAVLSVADGSLFDAEEAGGPARSAVAWCLGPRSPGSRYPVAVELIGDPEGEGEALRVEILRPGRKNGSHREPSRASWGLRGSATQPFHDASAWILGAVSPGMAANRER